MSHLNPTTIITNTAKGSGEEIQVQEQLTNVFFAEEREVASSEVFASEPTFSSTVSDQSVMPEDKWLLSEILKRPIQLPTIQWSTTQTFRTVIATIDIPRSLYSLSVVPITVLLSMMSFLRADWTIRLQLNSPKFSQGRLLVYFDPCYSRPLGSGVGSQNTVSIYNAMILPHAWLDPSESRVVELVLPFRHILNYFRLFVTTNSRVPATHLHSLGRLNFVVFNPLQVSTGTSSSVFITPSIYSQNPSVHVPTALHVLEIPLVTVLECGLTDAPGAILDSIKAGAAISSGSPDAVTSTLKAITSIAKVVSDLDRPLSYGEIMLPCNRIIAPLSHGSGVDSSVRLSLIESSQTVSSKETVGDADKEMDLSVILKIPTVFAILSWAASAGADTALAIFPVTPFYMLTEYSNSGTNIFNGSFTNLGNWASRFRYWRGGLRFRFSFVCTQFHAGRIRVSFFPNIYENTNIPSAAAGTSVPNMIMDLQTKKEFEFVVPFYASYPNKTNVFPVDAVNSSNLYFNAHVDSSWITGSLVVYILNPLIVNSGAPSSIPINCFMSAADDFEFSGLVNPKPQLTNPTLLTSVLERGLVEVPGDIIDGDDLIKKPTANILSHGKGIVASPASFMQGESNMNIKNIIRRFGLLQVFSYPGTPPNFPGVMRAKIPVNPCFYYNVDETITENRPGAYVSFVSSMFLLWRGSMRYKIVF